MNELPVIQWDDFPEAETMETRNQKVRNDFWYAVFWTLVIALLAFMFFGNWIISVLISQ